MEAVTLQADVLEESPTSARESRDWRSILRLGKVDGAALILALWAVPLSIAVSESLLAVAIVARIVRCARGEAPICLPRVFWFWLAWAALELLVWAVSADPLGGWNEIRRLFLIAGLFFVMPALDRQALRLAAWRGVFLSSTLGAVFLIGDFVTRLAYYRHEIAAGDDVSFFLRTGGLLNHWMVYGTVEILVVAGLLSFWFLYPEERRRWWPAAALNALAILLSLTRMLWVCGLLLLGIQLVWRRSRWLWALPLLPLALYFAAPDTVRSRVKVSMNPDYYSNFERVQMWQVGWRMVKEKPLTGLGPSRVSKNYRDYLAAGEPVPAYHGHLHNNLVQMAAAFGVPVALAALLFAGVLVSDLWRARKAAITREARFASQAGLLALIGFLVAGCFDYAYGHSLALILLGFAVFLPLLPTSDTLATGNR